MARKVLYYGGDIVTADRDVYAAALLTDGGRVLAVGEPDALIQRAGDDVEPCDLQGATLLPGFVDGQASLLHLAGHQAQPGYLQSVAQLQRAQRALLLRGVTTVGSCCRTPADFTLLRTAAGQGLVCTDVQASIHIDIAEQVLPQNAEYLGSGQRCGLGRLRIASLYIVLDRPDRYRDQELRRIVQYSLARHMQLVAHCQSPQLARQFADNFAAALQKSTECCTYRPVITCPQPLDVRALSSSALQFAGAPSPLPEALPRPLSAMRRLILGEVLPLQALKIAAYRPAYLYFEEDQKGILQPGARADLVLLSDNPLKVRPNELGDIRVQSVIKNGEQLHLFAQSTAGAVHQTSPHR
ncbi:amidohydrolase family protein [Neobittarella massiliensis]|uniref:amidohydrolase family protein n=1 Tax=Neobittarella massiliensis (ex Bilen et al. 2018) TaxID=2041842 RepID=UPI000CF6EA56|nr:amidohydrolase family protein [Neobittarella massiliensis]